MPAAASAAEMIAFVLDGTDRVRSVGPAIQRILGFRTVDVIGSPILDLLDPYDRERLGEHLRAVRRDPTVLDRSLAVRLVDATGRPVWMEATVPARRRLPRRRPGARRPSLRAAQRW